MTTLHDLGGVLGRPLDAFFGLSQFHGHGSWLMCEVPLHAKIRHIIYLSKLAHNKGPRDICSNHMCFLRSSNEDYHRVLHITLLDS